LADAVASQILVDGARNCVMKFTNVSDGTGEAAVLKVDVSALSNAPARVSLEGIQDVVAWHVPQDVDVDQDFTSFGGIPNNAGAGITGDIMFTTVGATAGDRYSIILKLKKD
jgi:hypothetical protein